MFCISRQHLCSAAQWNGAHPTIFTTLHAKQGRRVVSGGSTMPSAATVPEAKIPKVEAEIVEVKAQSLLGAIEKRNVARVRELLRTAASAVDIDKKDDQYSSTPLLLAVSFGATDIVVALLDAGTDPNKANDEDGDSPPLSVAATEGFVEIVSTLLAAGANILNKNGRSAMRDACNMETVERFRPYVNPAALALREFDCGAMQTLDYVSQTVDAGGRVRASFPSYHPEERTLQRLVVQVSALHALRERNAVRVPG
jgi:hypothetical protein